MRRIIDTEQTNLKSLFDDENQYEIPKFQREYSWEDEHVEMFWKDLIDHFRGIDSKEPYFFGAIILIAEDSKGDLYKIVDGQQRLSTSVILLAVIRDMLSELNRENDASRIDRFVRIYDDNDQNPISDRLIMNVNNREFFQSFILDQRTTSEKLERDSLQISDRNMRIFYAYKLLHDKLDSELKAILDLSEKIKFLISLTNKFLKYFIMVKNIVDTPARAYRIFDSINNRGIELSESDLVKNFLLESIDHDYDDKHVDRYHDLWLEILDKLDSVNVKEADFLRHYLIAYYNHTGPNEVFDRVSEKIGGGKDAIAFIEDLCGASEIYCELKQPKDLFSDPWLREALYTFNDLNLKVVFPVLLKGYDLFTSQKDFMKLTNLLLIFFFRSRIVCKTSATALESLMDKICRLMNNESGLAISDIVHILKESKEYPDNDKFEFNFSIFRANGKNAFYILKCLNTELCSGSNSAATNINKNNTSLEHIMPKTIKHTVWESVISKDISSDSLTEIAAHHRDCLWKIGNLTLLGKQKNVVSKNESYTKKLKAYVRDDIKMTNKLKKWKTWNTDSILSRQEELTCLALKIWSLK